MFVLLRKNVNKSSQLQSIIDLARKKAKYLKLYVYLQLSAFELAWLTCSTKYIALLSAEVFFYITFFLFCERGEFIVAEMEGFEI